MELRWQPIHPLYQKLGCSRAACKVLPLSGAAVAFAPVTGDNGGDILLISCTASHIQTNTNQNHYDLVPYLYTFYATKQTQTRETFYSDMS